MGTPERKSHPEIDPDIRPNLHAIQGGGQTTPERGNLAAVDDTAQNLRDQERRFGVVQGGGESTPERGDLSSVKDREETPSVDNQFNYDSTPRPQSRWQRLRSNKRVFTGIGVGGGITALIISGFVALLPLKLEMLVKSAMTEAMQIPQDAVEKRLTYLVSTYIAHKVLGAANPADTYPGTPVESMFKTWQASRIEEQFGIKIESNRTNNGQTATSWKVTYRNGEVVQGRDGNLTTITRTIQGSKEMNKFVKGEFKEKTKWYQFYKRYALRKTLMRTKGVTRWAWLPAAATEKIDNYAERKEALKKELRTRLYQVTIGRIIKRSGSHLACLTDVNECEKLNKQRFGTRIEDPPADRSNIVCPDGPSGDACRADGGKLGQQSADQINEGIDAVENEVNETIEKGGDGKAIGKIISKQLISKVAGGVGIVDTIARIVNSIDSGALNQVIYDRNSIAYVGYAAEYISIADQMKEGKLTLDQFNVVSEILDDYGSSPAWQQMTGALDTSGKRYERECGADGETTLLPAGQAVCPERLVIADKTPFTAMAWWQPLQKFADVYLATVGKLFDLFNKFLDVIGVDNVIEKLMSLVPGFVKELMDKAVNNVLELIFGAPVNGDDSGKEAGDNVAAGIWSSAYAFGETGLDLNADGTTNGTGLGIGGQILTPVQVAAERERIAREESEAFAAKSVFAQIFDTSDTRSLVSQLVIRTPTSTGELKNFASMITSSFASLFMPKSHAAASNNPFFSKNIMYGYPDSDNLQSDPKQYTAEKCAELEKAREENYLSPEETDYPIWVYTKSNPCALEKVVAASGAAAYSNEYPQDFALENDNSAAPATGDPAGPGNNDPPSAQGFVWPIAKANYRPLSNCYRKPGHTGIDIPIAVGTPVYAANAGTVVRTDPSGSSDGGKYIIIKHADGHFTNYQHLSSISVAQGATVTAGQNIGKSGNTGFSTGPHLHFSVTTQQGLDTRASVAYSINPLPFLPADRSLGSC